MKNRKDRGVIHRYDYIEHFEYSQPLCKMRTSFKFWRGSNDWDKVTCKMCIKAREKHDRKVP